MVDDVDGEKEDVSEPSKVSAEARVGRTNIQFLEPNLQFLDLLPTLS